MCTMYKKRPYNTPFVHPRGYVHKHGVHLLGQNHAKLSGLILEGLSAHCMPTRYIHN